ncbi:MAG TPA: sensor of ECF-type sigma factor [Bacteroidia bacterium]|nr:sensor of ECF-type sigma factor [Bacteroidia bacterium]
MNSLYKYFCTSFLVLIWAFSSAQTKADKKEQIAAFRVAFITKELNLSSKEAQSFWPVYNEYQDKLEVLRTSRRKENKKLSTESMTDQEAEQFVDNEIEFKVNEAHLQKQYFTRFKQSLPVKKVALLIKAEDDFKRELLKQLKDKN